VRDARTKQLLKNLTYRAVGEVGRHVRKRDGTLRVLMYHKVNALAGNTVTVPPSLFDEQMSFLSEQGFAVVSLADVVAYYVHGVALPAPAVLITFDDGYRDNLEQALPILERYHFPAVVFVPLDFVGEDRPLPHDVRLAGRGIRNPTLDWDGLMELERRGVRVESHGLSHRPLASLALDEARNEIVASKRCLEERLGRNVSAFAFVKGSQAHFRPEHATLLREAGYDLGFTSVTGANGPSTSRFTLRRYNVEPYPLRTFELVLAGACDALALKDTALGTRARKLLNAALGTSTK
jgi:peptidoglycan/xylan/chitin deacetylase (PgdA/CDA1 family)